MVLPPRSSAVPTAALVALFLAHRNSTEAQAGVNSMQRSTALNDLISLSRFSNGRNSKLFSPYLGGHSGRGRCRAKPGLHLFGQQNHRAARQRRIRPVLARVKQSPAIYDLLSKREQIV